MSSERAAFVPKAPSPVPTPEKQLKMSQNCERAAFMLKAPSRALPEKQLGFRKECSFG